MHLISSPMGYSGTDPKELYNNILTFVVKSDSKQKDNANSEMHIFQSVHISVSINFLMPVACFGRPLNVI